MNRKVSFSDSIRIFSVIIPLVLLGCNPKVQQPDVPTEVNKPKKNIILITVDTLRADHLSNYGYRRKTSPNVEKFSKEGLVFKRCYSTSSMTRPSFSSIFSGYYPHETTIVGNSFILPPEVKTLTEVLRNNGYYTAAFISSFAFKNGAGFDQGFHEFHDEIPDIEPVSLMPESIAKTTRKDVTKWLEKKRDEPFFLWVHFQDPHGPYTAPKPFKYKFEEKIKGEPERLKFNSEWTGVGGIPANQRLGDRDEKHFYIDQYDNEIAYFDHHFGKLVNTLKKVGLYEDSLIIFTSDHGESMGEHNYYFAHGMYLYRDLIHVPLIVKWKNKTGIMDFDVQQTDIFQTVCQLMGIDVKDVDGQNFLSNHYKPKPVFSRMYEFISIIKGDWHLIWNKDKKQSQLYNMKEDPNERKNLKWNPLNFFKLLYLKYWALKIDKSNRLNIENLIRERESTIERLKSMGYL